jgi:hypothetical protein
MSATTNEVLGVVKPDGTLELSGKLTMPPGRVKVRVESLEPPSPPAETLVELVRRTRREMEAAGQTFRTKAEIDEEIRELRDEWEERLEEVDRARGPGPTEGYAGCWSTAIA